MPSTLKNTLIKAEDYRDIYSLTSISSGVEVIIQNVGTTDLYFAISNAQPLKDNDAYQIFRRGEFITANEGDQLIWVFSPQSDGLINVERTSNGKLLDLLNTNFLLLNSQFASMIHELELLNLRIEEMGNTGINSSDVE